MPSTKETVLNFFAVRGVRPIPGDTEEDRLKCEYLRDGIIDSMGIVDLIVTLEKECGVKFTSGDMQSPLFQTPGGLVELIEGKK